MTEKTQFAGKEQEYQGKKDFPDLKNTLTCNFSQIHLFDMDGTLYQLDGENNGFKGSSLEKSVLQNALRFINIREGGSEVQALELLNEGLSNPVGISQFTSERYGISREEYFEEVWDIDPSDIVRDYEVPIQVINQLSQDPTRGLVLLTAAPKKWAERVMEFTGLRDKFVAICTGDQFNTKTEVFEYIAGLYSPACVYSIGDQLETDIEPAANLGMKTLLVDSPQSLIQLLEE